MNNNVMQRISVEVFSDLVKDLDSISHTLHISRSQLVNGLLFDAIRKDSYDWYWELKAYAVAKRKEQKKS